MMFARNGNDPNDRPSIWLLLSLILGLGFINSQIQAQVAPLSTQRVATLIKKAEPSVVKSRLWAKELLGVLKKHQFANNARNVCAVIAVTDQESGFNANPPIPGLGRLATKAVNEKLDNLPVLGGALRKWLQSTPSTKNNYMKMMRQARTERDLDRVYQQIVASMLLIKTFRKLHFIRNLIEDNNEIDTIGSMQVSSRFAIQTEEQWRGRALTLDEIWKLREWMYSVRGGLHYGTLLLLGYKADYKQKVHHFADYNAGRYASRNAAFQLIVSELGKKKLAQDGDLLKYRRSRKPTFFRRGKSEKAIKALAKQYKLALTSSQIRKDLKKEKMAVFSRTKTYRLIRKLYRDKKGRWPPYAVIPSITLKSEKSSHILTTKKFAQTVNKRYRRCISASSR